MGKPLGLAEGISFEGLNEGLKDAGGPNGMALYDGFGGECVGRKLAGRPNEKLVGDFGREYARELEAKNWPGWDPKA